MPPAVVAALVAGAGGIAQGAMGMIKDSQADKRAHAYDNPNPDEAEKKFGEMMTEEERKRIQNQIMQANRPVIFNPKNYNV